MGERIFPPSISLLFSPYTIYLIVIAQLISWYLSEWHLKAHRYRLNALLFIALTKINGIILICVISQARGIVGNWFAVQTISRMQYHRGSGIIYNLVRLRLTGVYWDRREAQGDTPYEYPHLRSISLQ